MKAAGMCRVLEYKLFKTYSNISGFTTTRLGGYAAGRYGSFNCSPFCGDKAEYIRQNQRLAYREIGSKVRTNVIGHYETIRILISG